jgi:NDP-sugar pyrophosphorylase family protein
MNKTGKLFSLENTLASELLENSEYPHLALIHLRDHIIRLGKTLDCQRFINPEEGIWIAKTARVASSALICGPCIIDENAEVRHCAFIRGNAIIGKNAVVGNSTEIKNSILFDGAQTPHYNYVGDSILGFKAHLGAGAITSNLKMDRSFVSVCYGEELIRTENRKIGAFVGDMSEIGCGCVLNPGSVIGKNTCVYPLTSVRGYIPSGCIVKDKNTVEKKLPHC